MIVGIAAGERAAHHEIPTHAGTSRFGLSPVYATVGDLEAQLGASLRRVRLDRNLEQATLAERAGISLRSLQRLKLGQGSTTHTLISVLRALGRDDWLKMIAPVPTINPLTMPRTAKPRQRATSHRKG